MPPARAPLERQHSRNYSRPFRPENGSTAQLPSSMPFPSVGMKSPANRKTMQRRMPSVGALSTYPGMRSGVQRRQASYQHQKAIDPDESVYDLLDKFPTVPRADTPLRRTVSLGGDALLSSVANAAADHKKSSSDPQDSKRSRKKSFGQALRGLFTRETRKSSAAHPLPTSLASPTSTPSTTPLPTPSDENTRIRTWTLRGNMGLSPKKKPPVPFPSRSSWEDDVTLLNDSEPPSPVDNGALADHEHLNPVTWARGKTVSITADGLTRKASVLRLDANTMLLRMEPQVGER
ncbi:hypothetical protein EXIGLDRAFT_773107, partial [Exidia glandulosa HHB12029]